jgi:phosphatidylglycerophosphatase A
LTGFVLFRLFDIWKPWPVRYVDQHWQGGLGIMLDDVIAGLMALIVIQTGLWFWPCPWGYCP